jgi:hypothetical protein
MATIHPLELDKTHDIYALPNFQPIIINREFLLSLGIDNIADDEAILKLIEGSKQFACLYENKRLTPVFGFNYGQIDLNNPLEVHNYTGLCPTYVQELTPSSGACSIACQYCLVTDGNHRATTTVWQNYSDLIANVLEQKKDISSFYYFSPKTEAFCEAHLET